MLLTICTIRQLPQALALGDSFTRYASESANPLPLVVIGLVDDPTNLPTGFQAPYPLIPLTGLLPTDRLATLSARYTPAEFSAACKPLFIREVFRRFPDAEVVIYADPNIQFFSSLTPVWERLGGTSVLLTPHITHAPNDQAWPDEKFFQNVGLYSADFLAFRRSAETDQMLAWWQDRVTERAYVNFCEGLCTDQLWLMHVPVFFPQTRIVKDPAWHVALWNLPHRTLRRTNTGWQLADTGAALLFANLKGLYNPDEGFFPYQTRLNRKERADVTALLTDYRRAVAAFANPALTATVPAYGQQPEPVVVRGWRRTTANALRTFTQLIDQIPLPTFQ